ncbi:hypothetical protein [Candidatus Hakubella thermalkaliphila]|uniref:Uncharacterized protein n=1 Tax=Candidatus Hakubella thermalkaliphila TaxID=2754717 RepID=A0A6V8QI32_9ACTN|nr:hypothetical protein [Candidatus Hakubella thermalkaliphila]GFP28615.1 hypothetical protein HKBW3S33_02029 [Candidatus Hakubella thermalkaliphila]GFP44090.1 hypothetical protein HKBW3C_03222 [Candidatus Hakubella thermalkaliphila]
MGWETRKGRGRYYTRSHKVNGRVVREYVGVGLMGELAAATDERRRARAEAERAERKRQQAKAQGVVDALRVLGAATNELMARRLTEIGYHNHRGQWRRSRKP